MPLADPTSPSNFESEELQALAPRVDGLDGKRIGLYDNGKMAAEPVLDVLEEKLLERYDDVAISRFSFETKDEIRDPENVERVKDWARDIDVCIGAIGDCGSCTKFLTWGHHAIEEVEVPTVGLVDEGFVLDWKTNAIERGRPLRYNDDAVRSEVRDHDLIAERLTSEVLDAIEDELTRPLSEKEQGIAPKAD